MIEKLQNKLFSTTEVAKILDLTPRTIQKYIKSGKLKAIKINEKSFKIPQKALEEYLFQLNGDNYEFCYWEQDPNPETITINVPIPSKENNSDNGKSKH